MYKSVKSVCISLKLLGVWLQSSEYSLGEAGHSWGGCSQQGWPVLELREGRLSSVGSLSARSLTQNMARTGASLGWGIRTKSRGVWVRRGRKWETKGLGDLGLRAWNVVIWTDEAFTRRDHQFPASFIIYCRKWGSVPQSTLFTVLLIFRHAPFPSTEWGELVWKMHGTDIY